MWPASRKFVQDGHDARPLSNDGRFPRIRDLDASNRLVRQSSPTATPLLPGVATTNEALFAACDLGHQEDGVVGAVAAQRNRFPFSIIGWELVLSARDFGGSA